MTWPSASPIVNALIALAVLLALLAAAFYAALPWIIQPLLRALLGLRYRVVASGLEHIPRRGPVLVALNHVSWLDGLLVAAHAPRRGKAMVNAKLVSGPILRPLALRAGIIPTPWSGPRAIRAALEATREQLDRGEAVAIFPEGQISRHGFLNPFQRGIEVILKGKEGVAVVPGAIDGLWGSNFSFSGGRFYGKWPRGWRRTVTVTFGPPLDGPVTAFRLQQAVQELLVRSHEALGDRAIPPDSIDPSLPQWRHPELGLLAASTPAIDDEAASVHQTGTKAGTVGRAVPGVAIRAVDAQRQPLPPGSVGALEALVAGRGGWHDTAAHGSIDRDGFITVATPSAPESSQGHRAPGQESALHPSP